MMQKMEIEPKKCWWEHGFSSFFYWVICLFVLGSSAFFIINISYSLEKYEEIKASLDFTEINFAQLIPASWSKDGERKLLLDSSSDVSGTKKYSPEKIKNISRGTASNSEQSPSQEVGGGSPAPSSQTEGSATTAKAEKNEKVSAMRAQFLGRLGSFSDSFSNLFYVDKSQTNMFWDENMTAFSFPPVFEVTEQRECQEADCGLSRENINPKSVCLAAGCLSRSDDNRLLFKNKEIKLPPALDGQKINNITLFPLDNIWLVGLVTGQAIEERGWVYRFDGKDFQPLITNETTYQIKPRYERGGGQIAFGGSPDDFIVFYTGYDGIAYRFRGDNIEDISKFFGLRITKGGFLAQILKAGTGTGSVFYVCNLTTNNPRIIKIWSKDKLVSGGALDLYPAYFNNDWRVDSILCSLDNPNNFKLDVSSRILGVYNFRSIEDKGFDNTRVHQISSTNLNNKSQEKIDAAAVIDFDWDVSLGRGDIGTKLFIANNSNFWEEVKPRTWQTFKKPGVGLYWRLVWAPGGDPLFSPWIDNLNRFDYLFAE